MILPLCVYLYIHKHETERSNRSEREREEEKISTKNAGLLCANNKVYKRNNSKTNNMRKNKHENKNDVTMRSSEIALFYIISYINKIEDGVVAE